MLHCNMNASSLSLQNGLEDLLGDLRFARKKGDLGRLALLTYCEVRRWARQAEAKELARHSSALVSNFPHASRDDFLAAVDELIAELEQARCSVASAPDNGFFDEYQLRGHDKCNCRFFGDCCFCSGCRSASQSANLLLDD